MEPHFTCDPDPENAGWLRWRLNDPTRYNEVVLGPLLVRGESDTSARVRLTPQHHHTNLSDNVHGGVTLGLIDVALFAAWRQIAGGDAGAAVTLGVETQFIGAGDPSRPLDAVVELLRETRRLAFMRGLVVQDEDLVAAFSGTIRKPSR